VVDQIVNMISMRIISISSVCGVELHQETMAILRRVDLPDGATLVIEMIWTIDVGRDTALYDDFEPFIEL